MLESTTARHDGWDCVVTEPGQKIQLADTYVLQIVNPKGEMKGSAITGPVGKEAAELWPVR